VTNSFSIKGTIWIRL